ncbi:histidine kinase [Pedobacter sp. BAL39]|uniref:tetratricopeptide repeat-containing sensor histidine kinase n=1 Tax=Pedobacter sp. BAL39 TaxID=391596 RepID=UPI0002E6EA63|nr:histidine kinase [Pedobacter sp. BAL39]
MRPIQSAKLWSEKADQLLAKYELQPDYKDNFSYCVLKVFKGGDKKADPGVNLQGFKVSKTQKEEWSLQQFLILKAKIQFADINTGGVLQDFIRVRNEVERLNSSFIYLYDDKLAMIYYRNGDPENSLRYTEQFKMHYPYAGHVRFKQLYYDIRFMLALKMGAKAYTKRYLDSCQTLAVSIKDTLAIMRSYEFEAQWLIENGQTAEAVEKQRMYFNYQKHHDHLQFDLFNNMAQVFIKNKQPDSAIAYLQEGLKWEDAKAKRAIDRTRLFDNLSDAYVLKGDYRNAYKAKDGQLESYRLGMEMMQKETIADLEKKYEAKKKDQFIGTLKANNALNEKLMVQQRWIFVILILFAVFVLIVVLKMTKQKLLKAENDQLLMKNKQLLLEQKFRQNQLNPHFIYNTISNLQGLISDNKKEEANRYLVRMTRVIRDMLELNRNDFITLDQEVKSLENYVALQQMRYNGTFDVNIDTGVLDLENVLIPPMLIQPFVENAIEHGLKNISHKGKLEISFWEKEQLLHIEVTDNGTGYKEANHMNKNKVSISQQLTEERIALLFTDEAKPAGMRIQPNINPDGSGYKVEVFIPLQLNFD